MSHHESTTVNIHDAQTEARGNKGFTAVKAGYMGGGGGGVALGRGLAILDFILRLAAIIAALAATITITMGTTNQTLNFFTQFFQFRARYYDLPAFSEVHIMKLAFFVAANAVASAYLVLSLPFSVISIVRPQATEVKFLLLALDTVAVALTMAGAGAAAAIVYLAHQGNNKTNWVAICQQFGSFCQRVSGAAVASFIAAFIFMILVILSAASLKRRN